MPTGIRVSSVTINRRVGGVERVTPYQYGPNLFHALAANLTGAYGADPNRDPGLGVPMADLQDIADNPVSVRKIGLTGSL